MACGSLATSFMLFVLSLSPSNAMEIGRYADNSRIADLLIEATQIIGSAASKIQMADAKQNVTKDAVLEGRLSYPSDHIPKGIQVCAINVAGSDEVCTRQANIKRTGKGTTFKLSVPAGVYHVFARLTDPSTFSELHGAQYRAYFSDFVLCGSMATCPAHSPVAVEAKAGARTMVDPSDWYDSTQNSPPETAANTERSSISEIAVDPNSANVRGVLLSRTGDELGAFALVKEAADRGDVRALANYGLMLRDGLGTIKDIKAGNAALEEAARKGDPFGVLGWGLSHEDGIGVPQSSLRAYQIWKPMFSSAAGPELKFWAAAWMGFLGELDAKASRKLSYQLLTEAADQGHRPALFYRQSSSNWSSDWKRALQDIERAVSKPAWSTDLAVEKLYVAEFFADNDDKLRWLLGNAAPVFKSELGIDLIQHVKELGFE